MKIRNILLVILFLGLFQIAFSAAAESPQAASSCVSVRIDRVALFKNGQSFFTSIVELPSSASRIRLGQLPVPSFGTFWISYPDQLSVRSLITSMEMVEEALPIQNIGQFLQMNPGRKAKLFYGSGQTDFFDGTILNVASNADVPDSPNPYFMDVHLSQRSPYQAPGVGNVLLVKTEKGVVALNSGSIVRAEFEGGDPVSSAMRKRKRPFIRLELSQPSNSEKVMISFLAKGLTWMPNYLLDLSDSKTAKLSANALIINEVADLEDVSLDLVTGFPNIRFGEVVSPVAMSQNLAEFLGSLAEGGTDSSRGNRYRGHGMMQQQGMVMSNLGMPEGNETGSLPAYSAAVEGTTSEDLFLYPIEKFSLKKGETAWLPLFSSSVPYKHLYTWKIQDYLTREERHQNQNQADENAAEEVWHSCRFVNNLKMPLTTAAAEFLKDGRFIGQDMCFYTAPGAETTIRINRALNVMADQVELEVDRKRNAANFNGNSYDQIKIAGTLRMRNRQDKPVTVEITKDLSGEVLESKPEAKDVQTAKGLKQVNPRHVLTWEIELQPGAEQKLSYVYHVFIRS